MAASLPSAATGSPTATLTGVVGPGFNISLTNENGTNVTNIDPGTYTINIDDRGDLHNFHLKGAGVDEMTDVDLIEMKTWTVTFQNGTYTYLCDAHPGSMKRTFTVGPSPVVPKLTGTITAKAITLKNAAGARVTSIPTNTYKIVVTDKTKKQNFHLIGPGVNRKTKVATTARTTWTLTLNPGKFTYRSDKNRKLRKTFTVTSVPPP